MTHQGSENGASEVRERSLFVVIVCPPQRIGLGDKGAQGKFSLLFRKAYLKLPQVRACSMPVVVLSPLEVVALSRGRGMTRGIRRRADMTY